MMNNMKYLTLILSFAIFLFGCGEGSDAATKDHSSDHAEGEEHGPSHGDEESDEDDHDDHGHEEEADVVLMAPKQAQEAGISTQAVTLSKVGEQLSLPAEIRFDADRIANVAPQVSGVIYELYASEGDVVEKGDRLALISSRELADLKAEYLSALSNENLAKTALAREEKLWKDKITSEADLMTARAAAQSAKANRESAENKLHAVGLGHVVIDTLNEASDGTLSRFIVTAPLAGTVVRRPVTLGESVVSGESGGDPLFTIVDDSVVWADIAVFKQDLDQVAKGNGVTLKDDDGHILATSTVSFISPIVDETSRTATARVVIANEDGDLRPGQFVTAEIDIGNNREVLRVPAAAVQLVEGQKVVFVPTNGGYTPRTVTTGEESGGYIEVREGLQAGEPFVAEGAFTLKAQIEKDAFGDGHAH